ncbi:MAG: hypothetical protein JST82_04375 [Bacteroidetes bacterium]|nr:hypothetical protein [Bacteroidota bacterium]
MRHLFYIIILLSTILVNIDANAQMKVHLDYKSQADLRSTEKYGVISFVISKPLTPAPEVYFYAQNDLKKIPMQLLLNKKPMKLGGPGTMLSIKGKDIFFTADPGNGYSWIWNGRAKAPLSPITDVNGQKVKNVKCWLILRSGDKKYYSDTVTIAIN